MHLLCLRTSLPLYLHTCTLAAVPSPYMRLPKSVFSVQEFLQSRSPEPFGRHRNWRVDESLKFICLHRSPTNLEEPKLLLSYSTELEWSSGPMARRLTTNQKIPGSTPG